MTDELAKPVIDLDITEIVALLLDEPNGGLEGAMSLVKDSLRPFGPVANQLVIEAMEASDMVHEFNLQRQYDEKILKNKTVAHGIKKMGFKVLDERGQLDSEGNVTSELVPAIIGLLTDPNKVIHTISVNVDLTRLEFVKRLASSVGAARAEELAPVEPANGYSYPITVFGAAIVATESGSVVIAPTDNAMSSTLVFDFQVLPPAPVEDVIAKLIKNAIIVTEDKGISKSVAYSVALPSGSSITTALFCDFKGIWTTAYEHATDDVQYIPAENSSAPILVAVNKGDLNDLLFHRNRFPISNLNNAIADAASIASIPLIKPLLPDEKVAEEVREVEDVTKDIVEDAPVQEHSWLKKFLGGV